MNIPSILCPLCNLAAESTSHIFFSCPLARQVWNKFLRWWEMDSISFDRYEDWLSWLNNTCFPKQLKTFLEGICYIMWWLIWRFRNQANVELRADLELKDTIMVAMPKLVGEGFYTCIVRVEYEWKPPRCACCKGFGHVHDECPTNIGSDVVNNLKKSLAKFPRGVSAGPKNVESSSTSTTPIVEKNDKIKKIIIDGKVTLVDNEGKPLEKVDSLGDHDSEDEVESVDKEMTSILASKKISYGTNSLPEQWKCKT
ncbi:putative RNA-directed DNA polymerase [Tanacetum coccineum]